MSKNKDLGKGLPTGVIIGSMVVLFALIIVYAVRAVGEAQNKPTNAKPTAAASAAPTGVTSVSSTILAVVKAVQTQAMTVTLVNTEDDTESIYYYSGTTFGYSKHGESMSIREFTAGTMVDASFDTATRKLSRMQVSTSPEVWEFAGANKLMINADLQYVALGTTRYHISDNLVVARGGILSDLSRISKRDIFTIQGIGQNIYSMVLVKGHGYLRLIDDADFIGGIIYIGERESKEITENMILTVGEGQYDVTVENGEYTGTVTVRILPGELVTLSVAQFGSAPVQTAQVTFSILPGGALYVDNVLTNYSSAVKLPYGAHDIAVTLDGYQTYNAVLSVDRSDLKFAVTLKQQQVAAANPDYANASNDPNYTAEPNDPTEYEDPADSNNTPTTQPQDTGNEDPYPADPLPTNALGDPSDSTSDVDIRIDSEHTITITMSAASNGAEVYFDGTFVGTVTGGKAVLPKYVGIFDVDLYLEGNELKTYTMQVDDDGKDWNDIQLPGF